MYVAAGENHTLCITTDGSLFAWGGNDRGQLGVGDTETTSTPTMVTGLQGKQVAHVAAGHWQSHTFCVTTDGSVFTWGASDHGKLGLGDDDYDRLVPVLVRGELQNKAVVQVATGDQHSACATEDGSVCTWGSNEHGQLGQEDVDEVNLLVFVRGLDANIATRSDQ